MTTSIPLERMKQVELREVWQSEPGDFTRDEFREKIRDQLSQEKSIRRLLDNLRKETHVMTRLTALPAPLH